MRYEIVVDDDDRGDAEDQPWGAFLYVNHDGDLEADLSLCGTGTTPAEALQDLASEWARQERVIKYGRNYEGLVPL